MNIVFSENDNPDFIMLCNQLDANLDEIVQGKFDRNRYTCFNTVETMNTVVVAYEEGIPVGCAAIREYDQDTTEIKRVFVRPEYRGKGISKRMMECLESVARNQNYARLILETGELLAASMRLYASLGFVIIPNYGPYQDMKESVCMAKVLQ